MLHSAQQGGHAGMVAAGGGWSISGLGDNKLLCELQHQHLLIKPQAARLPLGTQAPTYDVVWGPHGGAQKVLTVNGQVPHRGALVLPQIAAQPTAFLVQIWRWLSQDKETNSRVPLGMSVIAVANTNSELRLLQPPGPRVPANGPDQPIQRRGGALVLHGHHPAVA
jgi:hypothetical protein